MKKLTNEVLAKADVELKSNVGGWLSKMNNCFYGQKDELFAALSMDVNPLYIEEIKETITRWWDHFANLYGVLPQS